MADNKVIEVQDSVSGKPDYKLRAAVVQCIIHASKEIEENNLLRKEIKEIALQYGKKLGVKPQHIDKIMDMKVSDIFN